MDFKKRFFTLIGLLTVFSFAYFLSYTPKEIPEDGFTFKKQGKATQVSPTTRADIKKYNLPSPKEKESFSVLGAKSKKEVQDLEKAYREEIDPEWIERLGKKMIDQQTDPVKLFVRKIKTFVNAEQYPIQYKEIVTFTYREDNGNQVSYRAIVDPLTLNIEKRWDRTIIENPIEKPRGLNPSGRY